MNTINKRVKEYEDNIWFVFFQNFSSEKIKKQKFQNEKIARAFYKILRPISAVLWHKGKVVKEKGDEESNCKNEAILQTGDVRHI